MCIRVVNTKDLSHEEWLTLRQDGIGGSDAGAICGVNPYSSALNVYQQKTTDKIDENNTESIRIGHDLEDYVAKRFMEATGKRVRRSNFLYRSEAHPFMQANVDRLVIGEDAGLECKTANAFNADKWNDDMIPEHYQLQCQHYMAVTGLSYWYIAVVIMGVGFKWSRIDRDDELIESLIKIESDFWNCHVIPRVIPEPDGSKAYDELLDKYFHVSRKESTIPLIGFDKKLDRRKEITTLTDKLETEKKQIDQELKLYLQESEIAEGERYKVSWINYSSDRLDTKLLKQELPEVYDKYCKTTTGRRFTVREIA